MLNAFILQTSLCKSSQVIVFALVGLVSDDIIKAVVTWLDWYDTACRSSEHTRESLAEMDRLGERLGVDEIFVFSRVCRYSFEFEKSVWRLMEVLLLKHKC